ncbi:hypothetical protein AVEN_11387-1 [Araneus ventricosus]|uniref:Uncharacterized protein n=1 Tax=Araneus ventricosus TaxID=182803 RepID=A0A4Y2HDF2_ARAVE|nr:hypothetical protein AVEN_11387-1 [Araneus ventricosus]
MEENVLSHAQDIPPSSSRAIAQEGAISHSSVWKILIANKMHPGISTWTIMHFGILFPNGFLQREWYKNLIFFIFCSPTICASQRKESLIHITPMRGRWRNAIRQDIVQNRDVLEYILKLAFLRPSHWTLHIVLSFYRLKLLVMSGSCFGTIFHL